jgi:putative membrane protein
VSYLKFLEILLELIKLAGFGIVLGITTVIPGISTATMAIVLNIYDRLIEIITPNIKKMIAAWKFWLPLVIGSILGIIFFSKIAALLFESHPVPTYWFFIGIITGSIPLVYSRVRKPDSAFPALPAAISGILALVLIVIISVLTPSEDEALYTALTPLVFGKLAAGGALAAIAMIIPGISGSFLLLVIGMYRTIVQAVSDLNILLIVPAAVGAIIGVLAGAAFVRSLLAKVPRETYGAALGIIVGSLLILYPGGLGEGVTIIFSIISVLVGFAISFILGSNPKGITQRHRGTENTEEEERKEKREREGGD